MKKTLGILTLIGAIGLGVGCTRQPYETVEISKLVKVDAKYRRVGIEGLPSLVTYKGFVVKDSNTGDQIYIRRDRFFTERINFEDAKNALEKEITDSDEEKIKVYGIYKGDKTIEGHFVSVEGKLYQMINRLNDQ